MEGKRQKEKRHVGRGICRAAVLMAVALFVCKAPPWAVKQLRQNFYLQWLTPKRSQWEGILRLWSVYGEGERFDGTVMREAVRLFERKNRGAFVEYVTLPLEEVEEHRTLFGEPDLWLFPAQLCRETEGKTLLLPPCEEEENVLKEEFEFDPEEPDPQESAQERGRAFYFVSCAEGGAKEIAEAFFEVLESRTQELWKSP